MEELLNAEQVAKLLACRPVTVYKWLSKGLIPYYQLGKCKRMRLEDVEEFVREHRVEKKTI